MKKSTFTEEQIAFALRQAESGTPAGAITRKLGVSQQTLCRRKKKFADQGHRRSAKRADPWSGQAFPQSHGRCRAGGG